MLSKPPPDVFYNTPPPGVDKRAAEADAKLKRLYDAIENVRHPLPEDHGQAAPSSNRVGSARTAEIDAIRSRVARPVPLFYFCPRASIAARTFGGDIGNSVSRVPTARSIALAMAAIGGQMLTSAAPLAPYA
jgi:hypothetical protein